MHGALLEVRRLAAGNDLKRAFVAGMLEYIDGGRQLGEFGSRAGVFCTKGNERRMVEISPTDPGSSTTLSVLL
jgi:hypothetical protein